MNIPHFIERQHEIQNVEHLGPVRKSMSIVQYWVDTGKLFPADNFLISQSDSGSSLAEEDCLISLHQDNTHPIVNSSLDKQPEIDQNSNKHLEIDNSSSSSVDTAAYILANNTTTKKSDTIAIVEGSKVIHENKQNSNSKKVESNANNTSSEKISSNQNQKMCKKLINYSSECKGNNINENFKNLDEKLSKLVHEKSKPNDSDNVQLSSEVDEFIYESTCDNILPQKKLYNNTDSLAEFTPVSEENLSFHCIKESKRQYEHPALKTPTCSKPQYSLKNRSKFVNPSNCRVKNLLNSLTLSKNLKIVTNKNGFDCDQNNEASNLSNKSEKKETNTIQDKKTDNNCSEDDDIFSDETELVNFNKKVQSDKKITNIDELSASDAETIIYEKLLNNNSVSQKKVLHEKIINENKENKGNFKLSFTNINTDENNLNGLLNSENINKNKNKNFYVVTEKKKKCYPQNDETIDKSTKLKNNMKNTQIILYNSHNIISASPIKKSKIESFNKNSKMISPNGKLIIKKSEKQKDKSTSRKICKYVVVFSSSDESVSVNNVKNKSSKCYPSRKLMNMKLRSQKLSVNSSDEEELENNLNLSENSNNKMNSLMNDRKRKFERSQLLTKSSNQIKLNSKSPDDKKESMNNASINNNPMTKSSDDDISEHNPEKQVKITKSFHTNNLPVLKKQSSNHKKNKQFSKNFSSLSENDLQFENVKEISQNIKSKKNKSNDETSSSFNKKNTFVSPVKDTNEKSNITNRKLKGSVKKNKSVNHSRDTSLNEKESQSLTTKNMYNNKHIETNSENTKKISNSSVHEFSEKVVLVNKNETFSHLKNRINKLREKLSNTCTIFKNSNNLSTEHQTSKSYKKNASFDRTIESSDEENCIQTKNKSSLEDIENKKFNQDKKHKLSQESLKNSKTGFQRYKRKLNENEKKENEFSSTKLQKKNFEELVLSDDECIVPLRIKRTIA